jgi:hypothetical protein
MSFRLFIYYCALCGGWAAFFGWILGKLIYPQNEIGKTGIRGMFLGMLVALGLSLVDALWNVSFKQVGAVLQRVGVAVLVGCVGGLLGGILGQYLYQPTEAGSVTEKLFTILLIFGWALTGLLLGFAQGFMAGRILIGLIAGPLSGLLLSILGVVLLGRPALAFIFGWVLTGLLLGTSIGVFEVLSSIIRQQDLQGAKKKLLKGLIGGTTGGLVGGILALLLRSAWEKILNNPPDTERVLSPTAWGFVALGMCIGLLIGLAQVILKEAWIKVEKGRRAGREMILTKERTTIGRAESCDIGLFGDNQIEKLHAAILLTGNRYYLEDAATPTGTYVNDRKVMGRVPLQSGDLIRVGNSVLCFRERQKRSNGQLQPR